MWPSYRNKQLIAGAIVILIIAVASNEGLKVTPNPIPAIEEGRTQYPYVPFDIDPGAIDESIGTMMKAVSEAKPSPSTAPVPRPPVSAEAYLVANLDTGEVYAEKNAHTVFPIASISKLVTAIVATRAYSPEQKIVINQSMLDAYGNAGKLVLGDSFTIGELLYPLLLESSNDAAEAFAQAFGYTEFIQKMNAFVGGLAMSSTSFEDASGLSSGNVSNARDLFRLAQYIYNSEKNILGVTRLATMSVASTTEHGPYTWNTINPFPYDSNFLGGKTGRTTQAKESMISLFRYGNGFASYPIAIIVLRSDFTNREVDTSYLFSQFIRKIQGS